jgi:antitoxin HicB
VKKARRPKKRALRTGGSLEATLAADDLLQDAEAVAIKRVLAWQLEKSMKSQGVSKQALAARMSTSRSQLDRLLDPENSAVQLDTVARAARALGKRLDIRLVDWRASRRRGRQADSVGRALRPGKPRSGR